MLKDLIKGTYLIVFFKIIAAFASFVSQIIVSRLYGVKIYGEFSLLISIISFFMMVNLFGIDLYIIKKVNEYTSKATIVAAILKSIKKFSILGFAIIVCFFLVGGFVNKSFFDGNLFWAVSLVGLFIFAFSSIKLISAVYRAHGSVFRYSINENLLFQVPLLLILVYFFYFKITPIHPIWLYYAVLACVFLVSSILVAFFIKSLYRPFLFTEPYKKAVLRFSYPMMLTSSIIYAMSYVDTFMISYFLDNYNVGLYAGIIKLSMPLALISSAISSYLAPKIAKSYNNNELKNVKKMYSNTILILSISGLLIFLVFYLNPDFFLNFFGEDYTSETWTYRIYLFATFVSAALFGPIGYFLVMTENQKKFVAILIVALLFNLIANYFLIPKYGIIGAAIATLGSTVLWKFLGFLQLKRQRII